MKIIDDDWYDTTKALQAVEEQSAIRAVEVDSEPQRQMENTEMAKHKKVTTKQLMEAAAVLMRFLDEYQTVDQHNADAIVEYEAKVALVAIPLNIKKYERASSYSVVDLLQKKGEQNALTINPGEEIKSDLRYQIQEAREVLCTQGLLVGALDESGEPLLWDFQQVYKASDHATSAEMAFWHKENKVN
jgi:hypothetical protein